MSSTAKLYMYFEAGIFLAIKLPFLKAKENFSDKAWEGLLDVRLGLGLISISKHRLGTSSNGYELLIHTA